MPKKKDNKKSKKVEEKKVKEETVVKEEVKVKEVKKEKSIFEEYNEKFNEKLNIERFLVESSKKIAKEINSVLKKRGYDVYIPPKKTNGVILEKIILIDVSEKRFIGINHAASGKRLSSVRIKVKDTVDTICDEIMAIYEKMIEKRNKRHY